MPSFTTHYLTGTRIKNGLNLSLINLLNTYKHAFAFGCQGPDLWLFYGAIPWEDSKISDEYDRLANLVHDGKVNEFYQSFLKIIREETDVKTKECMMAYAIGHLCHWATDSTCHPYVGYYSDGTTPETRYWHVRLESEIDAFAAEKLQEMKVDCFPIRKLAHWDTLCINSVQKIYSQTFKNVWNEEIKEGDTRKAMADCHTIIAATNDTVGVLYNIIQNYEKNNHKEWSLSSHFITFRKNTETDILNTAHQTWLHPVTGEAHNESFWDLLDETVEKGITAVNLFVKAIEDGNDKELTDFLDNRNYSNGLSEENMESRYFSAIY